MVSRIRWIEWLLSIALAAAPGYAAIFYVTETGTGNGSSWTNACSLQFALANAQPNFDQVWVAQGTYYPSAIYPSGTDDSRKTFHIRRDLRVYGGFVGTEASTELSVRNPEANLTILDGNFQLDTDPTNNSYHVVYCDGADHTVTKLSGFVIRNGYADGPGDYDRSGGGVFIHLEGGESGPLLNRLVVEDNYAVGDNTPSDPIPSQLGGGGAIVFGDGKAIISNCTFQFNTVDFGYGGGLLLSKQIVPLGGHPGVDLQNCLFIGNVVTSGAGGGVCAEGVNFVNLTLFDNQVLNDVGLPLGGAFYWGQAGQFALATIKNSIVGATIRRN